MDENGTVELELPCAMRGWPNLKPGMKLRGRLEDCKNKWVKFDGNTPHMTMPYTGFLVSMSALIWRGSRISIVFFTRRGASLRALLKLGRLVDDAAGDQDILGGVGIPAAGGGSEPTALKMAVGRII